MHLHHDHPAGGSVSPMEELTALMNYMVGHNTAHARELADLAKRLEEAGQPDAYRQVMEAAADFDRGNAKLTAVLSGLEQQ